MRNMNLEFMRNIHLQCIPTEGEVGVVYKSNDILKRCRRNKRLL